jgi:hypothetical protein
MHGRAPVRERAAPPDVRARDRRLERARRSLGPPPRAWSLGAPGRSPPVRAGCLVGRCLARASRERRLSDSGALDALCHRGAPRGVPGLVSPAGRLPLPAAQTAQRLIAARLADYASAPRGGYQVSTTARTVLNRTRTVSGWRARPRSSRPERRPSRPVVSPTYAQDSYYGTNRVVASAPGRFTGPAAPVLSTAREAQSPGHDRRRSRSSVPRTGRVFRKNGTRAWYEAAGRLASDRGFEHVPALAPDRRSTRRADGDGGVRSRIVTGELH